MSAHADDSEPSALDLAAAASDIDERTERVETRRTAVSPRRFDPGRLIEISKLTRQPGPAARAGGTVLQAAAWVGEHRWTQGSSTIEPMIATLAAAWNEDLNDTERERRLRTLVSVLPGTAAVPGTSAHLLAELARVLSAQIVAGWIHELVTGLARLPQTAARAGYALQMQRFEAEAYDLARAGWWTNSKLDQVCDWLIRLGKSAEECANDTEEPDSKRAVEAWRRSGTRATGEAIEVATRGAHNHAAWSRDARERRVERGAPRRRTEQCRQSERGKGTARIDTRRKRPTPATDPRRASRKPVRTSPGTRGTARMTRPTWWTLTRVRHGGEITTRVLDSSATVIEAAAAGRPRKVRPNRRNERGSNRVVLLVPGPPGAMPAPETTDRLKEAAQQVCDDGRDGTENIGHLWLALVPQAAVLALAAIGERAADGLPAKAPPSMGRVTGRLILGENVTKRGNRGEPRRAG